MRLTELEPRWIHEHMFAFRCPHCRKAWLTCKDMPMSTQEQREAIEAAFGDDGHLVAGSRPDYAWTISSRDFDTMTVKASIDASPSGCWHGWITDGGVHT